MCPRTCPSFQRVQHQKPFTLILTAEDNLDISSSHVHVCMSAGELAGCLGDIRLNSTQVGSGCCCDVAAPPPLLRLCDIFQSLLPFTVTANRIMIIDRPAKKKQNTFFSGLDFFWCLVFSPRGTEALCLRHISSVLSNTQQRLSRYIVLFQPRNQPERFILGVVL